MRNYEILLLCKQNNTYTKMLLEFFRKQNIPCKMIVDYPSNSNDKDIIYYEDQKLIKSRFINLCSFKFQRKNKIQTAWDKSFYYLFNNLEYNDYYFIEDDVFCNSPDTFVKFFEKLERYDADLVASFISSYKNEPNWVFWRNDFIFPLEQRYKSLNCMCRLSRKLISYIYDFRRIFNTFMFHELLFANICFNNGLTHVDFLQDAELSSFFHDYDASMSNAVKNDKITHSIKSYLYQEGK